MAEKRRRNNRKGSDRDIIRANALGRSLQSIADMNKCHSTCVSLRLKSLEIAPADTRRNFLDGVWDKVPDECQDIIADVLTDDAIIEGPKNIKELIASLIIEKCEQIKSQAEEVVEDIVDSAKTGLSTIIVAFLCLVTFYPFPPDVAICPSMAAGTMAFADDDDELMLPALPFTVGMNGIPHYA